MELKEARYILAIAKHQSIGKAAESLYISQPSLSKYLKNLEERLGAPLFDRRENHYYPTYMGERYLYYAERIAAFGDQWSQEFDDIAHQEKGRLNIAAPIMMVLLSSSHPLWLSQALSLCYLKHYGSY